MAAGVGAHLGALVPVAPADAAHDHGVARLVAVGGAAVGVEELAEPRGLVGGGVLAGEDPTVGGLGLVDGPLVGLVAAQVVAVVDHDPGGVAPAALGELFADGVEVVGAEVGGGGGGFAGGEGEVAGVERGAPAGREDGDGHAGPHPGLGAADALAQLGRG
ncbi:MAG: hypothetical protein M5T61_16255 [Acidimicrobiia bacterium]|nr:hypothetical protein [Acidimicrobiia bacterium]